MHARKLLLFGFAVAMTGCSTGITLGSTGNSAPVARSSSPSLTATASVSVTLSAEQSAAVRAYYGQPSTGNGRGRGRNGGLPPGIARNLERGKSLPPGIAKQYLPEQLLVSLPRPGDGLEYIVAAGKLLLVEAATQIVRQVLLESVFG